MNQGTYVRRMWNVVSCSYLNVGAPSGVPVSHSNVSLNEGIRHLFYERFQEDGGHLLTLHVYEVVEVCMGSGNSIHTIVLRTSLSDHLPRHNLPSSPVKPA